MTHLIFQRSRVLVEEGGGLHRPRRAPAEARDPHGGPLQLGPRPDDPRVLVWPEDAAPPAGTRFQGLRALLPLLSDRDGAWAGRGRQLVEWREHHRYCGRCAGETALGPGETGLVCRGCGLTHFPRVSPAVIVLVHDGQRVLLGRAPRFPPGMYSTLAGFVEPGESAEEAIRREVREESGVELGELRYFGSQSWPFPHSLMLGFHARYGGGTVRRLDDELEDVRWFRRDELPSLPPRVSIARRLIEAFLDR